MSVYINKNSLPFLKQIEEISSQVNQKTNVGYTLDKRVATFVLGLKLLNDAATFATTKGTKAVCAATTLSSAIMDLLEGNIFKATLLGASGLKETYDLFMKDGTFEGIKALLKDNQAGLEIASEILTFNDVVLKQTAEGVTSMGKNLIEVHKDLSRLKQLSDEGKEELRKEKIGVIELYQSADKEYVLAQKNYQKGQKQAQAANHYFNKTIQGFSKIYALAQKEGAQISEAIKIAEKMQRNCEKAQKNLQECMHYQEQANIHSHRANEIYRNASFKAGSLLGKVEIVLSEIQEINNEAQRKVELTQQQNDQLAEKVNSLQKNNFHLIQVNEKLQENNQQLMGEVSEQFGLTSILMGAIPGAIAGANLGLVGGVAGGVVGLEVVHNRHKIARKTADWLFGIKKESLVTFDLGQKVAYKFDDNSSGFWGRYIQKRGSETVGTIAVQLGNNEIFEMRFDLKNKTLVKDADMKALKDILAERIATRQMPAKECLDIIRSLEKMNIASRAVISPENSFLYLLKNQCLAQPN